jgi:hypothetical protein
MPLTDDQRALLTAVVDRLVPLDRYPDAPTGRIVAELERRLATDLQTELDPLVKWLQWLENESFAIFSASFLSLHASTQDELLDRIESENIRTAWTIPPTEFFGQLIQWTATAYDSPDAVTPPPSPPPPPT